jgi:hypothetical protein
MVTIRILQSPTSVSCHHSLASDGARTKHSAIEDKLVAATFVVLENLDVDDTKGQVQYKEDHGDRNIRYNFWSAAETLVVRRIRRTFGGHTLSLGGVSDVHQGLTSLLLTGDATGSCEEDIAGVFANANSIKTASKSSDSAD